MSPMHSRLLTLLLVVTAPAVAAHSQGMTLAQAVAEAKSQSFVIRASTFGVEASESATLAARADYLPTLSLLGSASRYDGDILYNRFVGPPGLEAPAIPAAPFDTTASGLLTLSQVLYAGGGIGARVDAQRTQTEMARDELESRTNQLGFDVTKAFYDVLLAERALDVARSSIERSQQNLTEVRGRRAEDEALEVDLLGAESRLAADQYELIKAQNRLELAHRAFNHRLAREASTPVQLSGDLADAAVSLDQSGVNERALANSHQIHQAELAVELADSMLRGAKSHFKPKLQLRAFYSYLDNEMFFNGSYWGGSIGFSIPFFQDVRAGKGAAAEAKARRALEESRLAEARSGVSIQIERSLQAVEEAETAVELAIKTLEYHRERYRVGNVAFREQLATFSDLLEDHASLRQAELDVLTAMHQARLAEAEVIRLIGGV